MKLVTSVFTALALVGTLSAAPESRTYTGVVTDTMCGANHAPMKISPDSKCVRECVGDGKTYKYALLHGKEIYTLSDQQAPVTFAGQKVRVTGQLYEKTRILTVEKIEAVK